MQSGLLRIFIVGGRMPVYLQRDVVGFCEFVRHLVLRSRQRLQDVHTISEYPLYSTTEYHICSPYTPEGYI